MKVASFYRFVDIDKAEQFRDQLQAICGREHVLGSILVADEGINGTIAASATAINGVLAWIGERLRLGEPVDARWTDAAEAPFRRLRVRLKREIVALGRPDLRPQRRTGAHVSPAEWNELLDDPNVLVIDTRNHYEIEIGTFQGAIDPGTDSFRQFPDFAARLPASSKDRPVAMFCTGGIRCEKASALMLELGFDRVYQLDGGILNYLSSVPTEESRWDGECFVFDTRVAVDRDLAEGGYVQCHACRRPLSTGDLASADYREGVSCPKCIGELDPERASRLEERRRQVALARRRGEPHIGARQPTTAKR